jgi:hypothetical protein
MYTPKASTAIASVGAGRDQARDIGSGPTETRLRGILSLHDSGSSDTLKWSSDSAVEGPYPIQPDYLNGKPPVADIYSRSHTPPPPSNDAFHSGRLRAYFRPRSERSQARSSRQLRRPPGSCDAGLVTASHSSRSRVTGRASCYEDRPRRMRALRRRCAQPPPIKHRRRSRADDDDFTAVKPAALTMARLKAVVGVTVCKAVAPRRAFHKKVLLGFHVGADCVQVLGNACPWIADRYLTGMVTLGRDTSRGMLGARLAPIPHRRSWRSCSGSRRH